MRRARAARSWGVSRWASRRSVFSANVRGVGRNTGSGKAATPVGTVSVREAAEAISRGVVDGTPKDWLALHSFRIADDLSQDSHLPGMPLGTRGGIGRLIIEYAHD